MKGVRKSAAPAVRSGLKVRTVSKPKARTVPTKTPRGVNPAVTQGPKKAAAPKA